MLWFCLDLMLKAMMMMMIPGNGFLGGAGSVFRVVHAQVERAPSVCVCSPVQ